MFFGAKKKKNKMMKIYFLILAALFIAGCSKKDSAVIQQLADDLFKTTIPVFKGADGAVSVCAADLDKDGDMDLLAAFAYADKISCYPNELVP